MIAMQIDLATGGLIAGISFFTLFAVIAYVAFRMLRRTAKAAFRMAVVVIILAIAVVGGISVYYLGFGSVAEKPKPVRKK